MKRLLTKRPLSECKSFAKTNADPQEQARAICSPVSCDALTAKKSYTTARATALNLVKITSCAPLPVKKGKEVCDTHFIRAVVLEEGTLQHMRLVIQCIAAYEEEFRRALGAKKNAEARRELTAKKRTLQRSETRLNDLDRLFKRIYEDMVNGVINETRFKMLSEDYEKEQEELRQKIATLEEEIQNHEDQVENVDKFIQQAKKYLHLEKLTPTVLNDMVNAVYVHAPDKSSGHRVQDVEISYNYIGILPANLLYDIQREKRHDLNHAVYPKLIILSYWNTPSVGAFFMSYKANFLLYSS